MHRLIPSLVEAVVPPIFKTLPYTQNSAHWFARVRDLGTPVWLDSAWPCSRRGRYDIITAAPLELFFANQFASQGATDRVSAHHANDFFRAVRAGLDRFDAIEVDDNLPFRGGAIALLGYDLGRELHLLTAPKDGPDGSTALAGLYSWAIVSDHQRERTTLIVREETPPPLREELLRRVQGAPPTADNAFALTSAWSDDFPAAAYRHAFARLEEYIRAGDCYQVNLARRFHAGFEGDPFAAYLRLREIAAAPYSAYIEYEGSAVLCLSPERFLAARRSPSAKRELLTQPIKGTAPRASDDARDRELAAQLQQSEKNRAENLMIVDLLRNDLGRSCKPGSIRVEQLFELQSFATVHHLVSSIRGELRDDMHALDALQHCFPGGSITGAPKLRAMQIIDELEPYARSMFCGAIGYIDANGTMDTNITIRTLLAARETIYAWAGGGITADSTCDAELRETNDKIDALLDALTRPIHI